MTHSVEVVTVPAAVVAVVRFHVSAQELPDIGEQMGRAFGAVATRLAAAQIAPVGPPLSYYQPVADGFDVAAGFRVPPGCDVPPGLGRLELGDVETAHTTHLGAYRDLPTAYEDLLAETARAGREVPTGGPMWEEYWSEPGTPESETRTEIYWPLSRSG